MSQSDASQFREIASKMPELISEIKKDLSDPENTFKREFVIKAKSVIFCWGDDGGLEYHTEDHPNLQGKINVLENLGYIINVAKGNQYPRWRMTEEFVKLILKEG
jgi:hypothetical protein